MNPDHTNALATIALMAASADGAHDPREAAHINALVASWPPGSVDVVMLRDRFARGSPDLASVVAPIANEPPLARAAYETAVNVIAADGAHTPAEGAFLDSLARALKLPVPAAQQYLAAADALVTDAEPARAASGVVQPDAAELDRKIVDASVTNAALELLPESLATLAILPLQLRLVYRIGQAYGVELDQGHVKEFVATLGVGLTGQYLEQFGRRLAGGLLGSLFGGVGRAVGRQAASSGMAFATTWAIGQIARRYYAAGRTLSTAELKDAFGGLVEQGRDLVARYAPAIEERARGIDVSSLPRLLQRF